MRTATLDKEAVRRANPVGRVIPDLLNERPIEIGGELKVRCPFHDDTRPSLRINTSKGVWRCDPCDAGGDVFDFVQQFEHLAFPDALALLAELAGVSSQNGNGHRPQAANGAGPAKAPPRPARWPPPNMLRSFDYPVTADLLACKVRYDEAQNGGIKSQWFHSRDGGASWLTQMGCDDPGLYGFDDAMALLQRTHTNGLLITEGERDARRLLDVGWPAMSPPHGGAIKMDKKWRPDYTERLKAAGIARAYVLGDADDIGKAFNDGIVRALTAEGIDARPVPWAPDAPKGFDVTDLFDQQGNDEAKRLLRGRIEAVKAGPPWRDPAPAPAPRAEVTLGDAGGAHPVMTCLADVTPEAVTWIWPGRVAAGKLNLIVGDPGLGKSFVTLDMVGRYTTGREWPDGSPSVPIGTAILLSAEDGLADTIRPRLDALGADPARVYHVGTVVEGRDERGIQLADVEALERAILQRDAGLVVIDPVSAYIGEKDSHRDSDVRGLLAPLAQLAERHRVTIVGVMHLSKGTQRAAIHRPIGSIAFVGAARVVLAVAVDPDCEGRRLFAPIKNNLSRPAAVLAFSIPEGRLVYESQAVDGIDINDVLRGPTVDRDERLACDEWLQALLAEGPVLVKEIQREAKAAGMSWSTVERAKMRLRVRATKDGLSGPWSWEFPKTVTEAFSNDGLRRIPNDSPKAFKSNDVTVFEALPVAEAPSLPVVPAVLSRTDSDTGTPSEDTDGYDI
jgi:putative DNA primase/helicase